MEIKLAVLSVMLTILIPLIVWIRKTYWEGPELTVELKKDGGTSSPIGFSNKNVPDENGVVEMREAIQIFRLKWDLEIIIRNNSEYTAFYPQITFKDNIPYFVHIDKINEQEPIASKETITIKATYQELEEAKGIERNNMVNLPPEINDIQILLQYKNGKKINFYTLYKQLDRSNTFFRKSPKKFNS